jgi:glycosyltransferase involved in cell wall biosynthesis
VHLLKISEPWGYVLNALKLRKLLMQLKPDLFHVHYASGYGTLGTLSGYQPRIVSVWGHDIFNFPYESIYSRILILLNLRTATWICSTSGVMAHQTVRILKSTADRISVTPFGVDLTFFKARERNSEDIVIGTVKTLAPKYGIDVLIKGFAKARERLRLSHLDLADRMKLRIVGGGHWREYLERLAGNCGVSDVTTFLGHVSHEQVPHELNKLDIYVAMSREDSESFGVAIIEASACELPVVVSNAGGLKEVVIEGVTGAIIPQDDIKALSDQLVNLVLDQNRRELYGKAGRSHVVNHYEWNKSVSTMESVYALVLSRVEPVT